MFFPVSGWIAAFALTLAVELPIAVWLLRQAETNVARRIAIVVLANLATHPAVWYVFSQFFLVGTLEYTLAAEGWAFAIEAIFYFVAIRGVSSRRAVAVALVANGASFVAGRAVAGLMPGAFR
jgi:hypothetical protein